jgi:hypothetical protein
VRYPALSCGILLAALLASACGYRFVDERAAFGPDLRRIEIRAFENRSDQAGYEQLLADSLVEEFARRGALQPVYGERADLILDGRIRDVRVRATSFSSIELEVEDSVEIALDVKVRRSTDDQVLLERRNYRFSEIFSSSPDPQTFHSNKEQALRRLSALIAERISDELLQIF